MSAISDPFLPTQARLAHRRLINHLQRIIISFEYTPASNPTIKQATVHTNISNVSAVDVNGDREDQICSFKHSPTSNMAHLSFPKCTVSGARGVSL